MQRPLPEGGKGTGGVGGRHATRYSQYQERRPDLQDALVVLRQRKWSILGIAVIIVGLALAVSARQTPVYESQASVLVASQPQDTNGQTTPPNLATEAELAGSTAVANVVIENLDLSVDPQALAANLSVDSPADTEILELSYRHRDPATAQTYVQAFAEGYLEYRRRTINRATVQSADAITDEIELLQERLDEVESELALLEEGDARSGTLESEITLLQGQILQGQLDRLALAENRPVGTIVQPADPPGSPVSPNHMVNAGFGLIAGLALGIGLAFLGDRLSRRLKSDEELEAHMGAALLGTIPRVPSWRKRKQAYLVTRHDWRSRASEAYRILRTNLLSVASVNDVKTILVTSGHPGEGKSVTAANLGLALARAGKRTVLVSADLRKPRLHEFFGGRYLVGLADVLIGRIDLDRALVRLEAATRAPGDENLQVLTSGQMEESSSELLASPAMEKLIKDLRERSDMVIIDAPPVLSVTDAIVLSKMVDGVLLVVGPRNATSTSVSAVRQRMERVDARILGVVLNGPDPAMTKNQYTY